jgi:hypothetical protein
MDGFLWFDFPRRQLGHKELNMAWIDRSDVVKDHAALPPDAFTLAEPGSPIEVSDTWIVAADDASKLSAIRVWFHDRYIYPDLLTPWDVDREEYIFVHGGPFDGERMVRDRFDSIVGESILSVIAAELCEEENMVWAPDPRLWEPRELFDPRFSVAMDQSQKPLDRLRERLDELRLTGSMTGDRRAHLVIDKLAFSGAIGAFEAFLWETVDQQVGSDDQALRAIVTKIQVFSDRPLRLGELFDRLESLRDEVRAHLQHIV